MKADNYLCLDYTVYIGYHVRCKALKDPWLDWFASVLWLDEMTSVIYNFSLSVEAHKIVWVDLLPEIPHCM